MEKIIIGYLFCICMNSCTNCEKLNLTFSEKAWVIQYKLNQQFLYKNSKGQIDTFIVKEIIDKYTPCNKFELSNYQYEIYSVIFSNNSTSIYNNEESSLTMTTQDWKQKIPYIYFGNLGPHRNDLKNKIPTPLDTVLNGRNFKSVYHYSKELNTEQYGEIEYFKDFF